MHIVYLSGGQPIAQSTLCTSGMMGALILKFQESNAHVFMSPVNSMVYRYRLMSVRDRQNLKCLPKIVPRAKQGKKKCKQTPEDVLRTMASLGSG